MASQIGFEPTAFRLGGEPSIQLRYWDLRKIMPRLVAEPLPLRRRLLYPAELRKHIQFVKRPQKADSHAFTKYRYYTTRQKKFQVLFTNINAHRKVPATCFTIRNSTAKNTKYIFPLHCRLRLFRYVQTKIT